MKKIELKKVLEYFLTKLCHYDLFKDSRILCINYQNWSKQNAVVKTFLRYEDLKVS